MPSLAGRLLLPAAFAAVVAVGLVRAVPLREPRAKPVMPANAADVRELGRLDRDVHAIVWAPQGKEVAFVSWEKPVEVVAPGPFRALRTIGAGRRVIHFAFGTDRDTVALCVNGTKQAEIHNLRTRKVTVLDVGNDQPGVHFSPDGRLLATGGYGTTVKLWSAATGALVRTLDAGPTKGGLTPVFSPDGKTLAVGNRNATTGLFAVATGKLLHTLNRANTQELKFSPDGQTLAVAYVDAHVGLWRVADGKLLRLARARGEELYTLDWSPRGDVLATAGLKARITLWSPHSLTVLKELQAPEWVISVRFSPDGTRLLSAGGPVLRSPKRMVQLWGVP